MHRLRRSNERDVAGGRGIERRCRDVEIPPVVARKNRQRFDIINPATSAVLDRAPDATVDDAKHAIEKSVAAFASWKAKTAFERSAILRKWYEPILADEATLAPMMTQEMGKPITESRGEVSTPPPSSSGTPKKPSAPTATSCRRMRADKRLLVTRQPVGPVYAVTPWNFPAAMVTRKVAPALAAGCTVVLKPAEQSPLTAIRLEELWVKAGGPEGVFQVVTTSDPAAFSDVFFDDPRVRKLTFTGSTEVGIKLYAKAARTMKRVSLELGGHAPFIIFEDADIPAAGRADHGDEVSQRRPDLRLRQPHLRARAHPVAVRDQFADAVKALRVGDPMNDQTQIGPLVDRQGLDKVAAHVDDAVRRAPRRSSAVSGAMACIFDPTVLVDVERGMRILEEETFGPVAPIVGFSDEAEAFAPPTPRRTGWRPTSGPAISAARSASPKPSTTASSASTTACRRRRMRRLAA